MIRVSLEFATQEELVAFFSKPQIIQNPPIALPEPAATGPAPAEPATPARRGRKPKDPVPAAEAGPAEAAQAPKVDAPSSTPASASAEATGPLAGSAKTVGMDDVRAAAQKVIEKLGNELGMDAARKVLTEKAGVKVLRDIPTDKFGGVLEGLKALLEGK